MKTIKGLQFNTYKRSFDIEIVNNNSSEFNGEENELIAILNMVSRKFKKFKTFDGFNNNIIGEVHLYLDQLIDDKLFDIYKINKPTIFNFLHYNNNNYNVKLTSHLKFDKSIDYDRSLFIELENHEDAKNILILIENELKIFNLMKSSDVYNMIKHKLSMLIQHYNISIKTPFNKTHMLTSADVCSRLNITTQKLAYWRKINKIKYTQQSERKFEYNIDDLLLLENNMHNNNNIINYKTKIIEWVEHFKFRKTEKDYNSRLFFLNFGNIHSSSPQVMLNNKFQLIDFINNKLLIADTKDVYNYLTKLTSEDKEPLIDSSLTLYTGFDHLYLNNL